MWKTFNEFFVKLNRIPNNWETRITLFIGYLIDQGKQSQTIRSYTSALKAVLAEVNMSIYQDEFLLSALTRACKFKNDTGSMRLPIRKGMLRILLDKVFNIYIDSQPYLAKLYTALFSMAYYRLFRVGELTSGTHTQSLPGMFMWDATKRNFYLYCLHPKHMGRTPGLNP